MELRHLRYFIALAGSLSFTKAADRVHVTQSTLSHQIRQLEEEVGRPLFERKGKRVCLTEAGQVFAGYATRALHEIDQGLGNLKTFDAELTGHLRIGATHTFNLRVIPSCMAAFMSLHPTVQISVHELPADAINDRLQQGGLDLGISYRPQDAIQLDFEPLFDEEMKLVVRASHPFATRKRVRMAELNRQRMVLLPREFATRSMLDEYFRLCGAQPAVVAEMNTIAPMLGLVSRTDVAAIVVENAILPSDDLRAIALEGPTPFRTPGILWRRDGERTQQALAFAAIVRKLAPIRKPPHQIHGNANHPQVP